jgi:carboxypeptidase Q
MKYTAGIALVLSAILFVSFKGDKTERVNQRAVTRIKNEGLNNSKVMETLFELTDVNGPRLTGSTGMRNAELWAKKKLKGWGLKHAQIEPWGGFGKGWEINKCYVAMTVPYYQSLIAVPRAWTPGTNGLTSGKAIWMKVDSMPDLRKYVGKLNGKIVVLSTMKVETKINFTADAKRLTEEDLEKLAQDPPKDEPAVANANQKPKAPQPLSRAAMQALRRSIDSFLIEEGAVAVLSGGRGTMGTVFTSNGSSRAWNAKRVLPELEMNYEHLALLIRLLDAGKKVNIEMDTRTTFLDVDSTESNVVAEIPGVDPELKDELVIIGAHMDSWHASTGATDNGTGVAVMMEAVRILKALNVQPHRTIRIVLWSGEEQGLLGSRAYVKNHFADRMTMELKPAHAKVSAYYNLDNGAGKIRGIYMQGNEELRPIFQAWLQPFSELGASTLTIKNTGSTDHISFDEVGIPGFQFIQDPLEYGTRTHHTNMDSYDHVNEDDLKQASVIVASFVYNTAMRADMLPRKPLPKPAKP